MAEEKQNMRLINELQRQVDNKEKLYIKAIEQNKPKKKINDMKLEIIQLEKQIEKLFDNYKKDIAVFSNDEALENLSSNQASKILKSVQEKFTNTKIHSFIARNVFKTGLDEIKHKHQSQANKNGRKNNDSFYKIQQFENERCFIPSNTNCFFKVLDYIFKDKPEILDFLKQIYEKHKKPFKIGVSNDIQFRVEKEINEEYKRIYNKEQFLFIQQLSYSRIVKSDLNKYQNILVRCDQHICLIRKPDRNYNLVDCFYKDLEYIEKKLKELKIDQSIDQYDIDNLYTKEEVQDCQNLAEVYEEVKEKKKEKVKFDRKQTIFVADFETMQKDEKTNQEVYAAAFYTDVVRTDFLFQTQINGQKLFDKTKEQVQFYQKFTELMKNLGQIEEKIQELTIYSLRTPDVKKDIMKLLVDRKQLQKELNEHEQQFPSKNYFQEKKKINQEGLKKHFEKKFKKYCQQYDEENEENLGEEIQQNQQQINQIYFKLIQKKEQLDYQKIVKEHKKQLENKITNDFYEMIHQRDYGHIEITESESESEKESVPLTKEERKKMYEYMQKMEDEKTEEEKQKELEKEKQEKEELDKLILNSQEQIQKEILEKFGTEEEYYQKLGNIEKRKEFIQDLEQEQNELEEVNKIHENVIFNYCLESIIEEPDKIIEQQYEEFYLNQNGIKNSFQLTNRFLDRMFSYTRNFPSYEQKSICYFHNGKAFDFYFILKNIDLTKYSITDIQIDGQQILNFTVSRKSIYKGKTQSTQIQFKCSTRIIPGSLKNISKDMQLSFRKIEIDSEVLLIKNIEQFEGKTEELIKEYLFFDVLSLAEALTTFRNGLFQSYEKMECFNFQTTSQISTYIYQKFVKKYDIDLRKEQYILPNVYQNVWLSEFPIGGRTNCYLNYFIKNSKNYKPFPLFYLDMTSLYPSAMKEICKDFGGYPHFNKNTKVFYNHEELITKFNNYKHSDNDIDFLKEAYFVECDIYQPLTKDFMFQNYQLYNEKGEKSEKVYKCNYPEECFIKQKFTNIDLFYAIKYNGAVIKKIHHCMFFPDRINLKHDIFMDNLVEQRNKYKKENNEVCQLLVKLMMNGLFGKLIQKPIFEKTHIVTDILEYRKKQNLYLKEGYFEIGQKNQKKFVIKSETLELFPFSKNIADPVTGSFLLSFSKHMVNQMLIKTNSYKFDEKNIQNFCYYSDTDSIIVGQEAYEKLIELGLVGKKLGQIKLEHFIQPGTFESYGKKIYRYQNEFFEQDYRFKGLSLYNVSKTQKVTEEEVVNQCFDFMRKHSKQSMSFRFQQFVKDLSTQDIIVQINEKVVQATFQNEKLQEKIENIIFFKNRLQTVSQQQLTFEEIEENQEEEIEEIEENQQEEEENVE